MSKTIERRLGTDYGNKFLDIEDLAKKAIFEALIQNCKCELRKLEED